MQDDKLRTSSTSSVMILKLLQQRSFQPFNFLLAGLVSILDMKSEPRKLKKVDISGCNVARSSHCFGFARLGLLIVSTLLTTDR